MSTKLDGLSRRLAKVEKAVAEEAERERFANCNCKLMAKPSPPTIVYSIHPEEFETEMNQTCPVHGFRRLKHIIVFKGKLQILLGFTVCLPTVVRLRGRFPIGIGVLPGWPSKPSTSIG